MLPIEHRTPEKIAATFNNYIQNKKLQPSLQSPDGTPIPFSQAEIEALSSQLQTAVEEMGKLLSFFRMDFRSGNREEIAVAECESTASSNPKIAMMLLKPAAETEQQKPNFHQTHQLYMLNETYRDVGTFSIIMAQALAARFDQLASVEFVPLKKPKLR